MRQALLICVVILLCCGCNEESYDLSGEWTRSTNAECVGDINGDFLSSQLDLTYSGPSRMAIEQDGEELVLAVGDEESGREPAVIQGNTIELLLPQPKGWIAECDCYWDELWSRRIFTLLDNGHTIIVEEMYESRGHTTVCTHAWDRHFPT